MKIAFFSSQKYDQEFFDRENLHFSFDIEYFDTHLGPHSLNLTEGFQAVCTFVNDKLNADILKGLADRGVKYVALRCAGFNQLDIEAAKKYGLRVCRVPEYSPYAVAEHAVALILALNRKTHKAYWRVREQNFSINGLLGFDLHGKTIGIIGTGHIGSAFARIMKGFGCTIVAHDIRQDEELKNQGVRYLELNQVLEQSDVISLHCPLVPGQTQHIINAESIARMKPGVVLINTSRGGLIDTKAVIGGLKSKKIGALGIDVYEQEERLFFHDLTTSIIDDDVLQRLISFPNVLITAHQAFFTTEALTQISQITLNSLKALNEGREPESKVLLC